eukprot:962737-Rhodomonas_salina.1
MLRDLWRVLTSPARRTTLRWSGNGSWGNAEGSRGQTLEFAIVQTLDPDSAYWPRIRARMYGEA